MQRVPISARYSTIVSHAFRLGVSLVVWLCERRDLAQHSIRRSLLHGSVFLFSCQSFLDRSLLVGMSGLVAEECPNEQSSNSLR